MSSHHLRGAGESNILLMWVAVDRLLGPVAHRPVMPLHQPESLFRRSS